MNNKERMELAKWASDFAMKQGASEAAVAISRSRSVQVEVREQRIETIRESTDNNLSLQIYRDQKFSSHSTNNLHKRQLERFISEAVEATTYLSPDEDRGLPDPALYPDDLSIDLGLTDPQHDNVSPEFRVQRAMDTEQLIRDANVGAEVLSVSARFNDNASEGVRVHSNGFMGETTTTSFTTGATLSVMDQGARPAGSFFASTRFLNELPHADVIAQRTISDTVRQLGQSPAPSGRYTMIIDNRVAGNVIFRLFQPLSARNIQQRNSYLIDMIDQRIASEQLTIIDDPFIRGGLGSRLFDGEGIAASKRYIIDKGVLKTYLIDNYYGRKLDMIPNGGSTSNVILALGNRGQEEIIAAQDKAILITSFSGGNANSTTGDFSFGIAGQLIENGRVVRAVNEMNISGNMKNLWNQLAETGNDPYPYSPLQSPTMVFLDVDFSGL